MTASIGPPGSVPSAKWERGAAPLGRRDRPFAQRADPQGPSSHRSVRAGVVLAGVQLSRSGVQFAAPVVVGAAFQSSPTLGGSDRPYVSTRRVTIRPPPKTQAA